MSDISDATLQLPARETEAWKELALLSLAAATDHAVHCGNGDVETFRRQIRESLGQLKSEPGVSHVLIAAGSVSQALGQYNARTQQQVDTLVRDATATVDQLIGHLEKLHPDAERQPAMTAIRSAVNTAFQTTDLGGLPETLAGPLAELYTLTETKRTRQRELLGSLQDRVTILEQTPVTSSSGTLAESAAGLPFPVDACTGLHLRAQAEAAVRRSLEADTPTYLAVFYLHRMALTNARFGAAVGNQAILLCSKHIAAHLTASPNDQLFRWSGPAFVAILERPGPGTNVHAEVQHAITAPMSRFFETSTRTVYLPIKMTAEVIELQGASYPEVADSVERFILAASASPGND